MAGLAFVLLLCAPASAQSYFSEYSSSSTFFGEEQETFAPPSLESLFEEVGRGNGNAVYDQLQQRFEQEMRLAAAEEDGDPVALHRIYLIHLLRAGEGVARAEDQERTARAYVEHYPDGEQFPTAFFYLNQALFRQGKSLEESFFFDQQALESLPAWVQTRYLLMGAKAKERAGEYADAASLLLQEAQGDGTLRQTTRDGILDMLERLTTPEALHEFLRNHSQIDWLWEREALLTANALMNSGQLAQALLQVQKIVDEGLAESEADLKWVDHIKKTIRARVATHAERIGVLLPLGSSSRLLRGLARETLEGLRMAVQYPAALDESASSLDRILGKDLALNRESVQGTQKQNGLDFQLVVRDTANSPQLARRQVEALVRDEQVVAIIGPLARAESEAAAERAEQLSVPLISFSLSLEVPETSRFTFRHSKSQREEVQDLVRFAIDYRQARRFAILYPQTRYGENMMRNFWNEVERNGGQVVAAAPFLPTAKVSHFSRRKAGFDDIFKSFTGQDRPLSEEERRLMEAVGEHRPDPIVKFDALFIPIGPNGIQDLQQIAPYPVTVDAEHVLLLGSRFWNDDAMLVAGDGKLERAVFVGAFDRTSNNPKMAAFRVQHRAFFGYQANYQPPSYYTALAYDTVKILKHLLSLPQYRSRESAAEALRRMKPFFGITGWTRFDAEGLSVKETMFFMVKNNEIVRVAP